MEGNRLAAMASMGPMIRPEPARRAMVPRTARSALCKIPASPLASRMTTTPRIAWKTAITRVMYTSGPKGARLRLKTICVKTEELVARNRNPARVPARQNAVRREPRQKIENAYDLRHQVRKEYQAHALALPEIHRYELEGHCYPLCEAELLFVAYHQAIVSSPAPHRLPGRACRIVAIAINGRVISGRLRG